MKPYLISLAVGLLVGVIYSMLNVRSPAPPAIALIGLLGMLVGEQALPLVKRAMGGHDVALFVRNEVTQHIFGRLPDNRPDHDNQNA
jgi:XapX domain-containing protein